MKKKILTLISASFAVLALASCDGGGKNAGKHPKITFYGIDSLQLEQNGTVVSKDDLNVEYGKDVEFTLRPNNKFAGINRWTKYGYYYDEDSGQWVKDVDYDDTQTPLVATPYVGFGNYLYPEEYALVRDISYTYTVNEDGSATLKIPGDYFQRNLIVSFDRGVTGNNNYCVPVQQLGLDDILKDSYGKEYEWWDLSYCYSYKEDNHNIIYPYHSYNKEGKEDKSPRLYGVKYDRDVPYINDSLLNDHATITLQYNSDVPTYLVKDIKVEVYGISKDGIGETKLNIDVKTNNVGQYFINIPFINEGKNEALLVEDKSTEYGYSLKYKSIQVRPTCTQTITNGIEVYEDYDAKEADIDLNSKGFVDKDETIVAFYVEDYYERFDGEITVKDHLPTISLTLNNSTVTLDYKNNDCIKEEWDVTTSHSEGGVTKYTTNRFISIKDSTKKWQLTIYYDITDLEDPTKTSEGYYYYFNPTSYSSLYSGDDVYSTIKANISIK